MSLNTVWYQYKQANLVTNTCVLDRFVTKHIKYVQLVKHPLNTACRGFNSEEVGVKYSNTEQTETL